MSEGKELIFEPFVYFDLYFVLQQNERMKPGGRIIHIIYIICSVQGQCQCQYPLVQCCICSFFLWPNMLVELTLLLIISPLLGTVWASTFHLRGYAVFCVTTILLAVSPTLLHYQLWVLLFYNRWTWDLKRVHTFWVRTVHMKGGQAQRLVCTRTDLEGQKTCPSPCPAKGSNPGSLGQNSDISPLASYIPHNRLIFSPPSP